MAHCAREYISLHVLTRSIHPVINRWWCVVQNSWRTDGCFPVETQTFAGGEIPPGTFAPCKGNLVAIDCEWNMHPSEARPRPGSEGNGKIAVISIACTVADKIQVCRPQPRRPLHNQASSQQTCIARLCCPALKNTRPSPPSSRRCSNQVGCGQSIDGALCLGLCGWGSTLALAPCSTRALHSRPGAALHARPGAALHARSTRALAPLSTRALAPRSIRAPLAP